ncbi:HEPN domain-containing protein [Rhizobium leguminosarum]|uniref:HEPN domain-containing protein n=1 Tax=Rhizobium leguminosarum TaxID=384 RepID=UPI0028F4180B|nr:HEPN domain-containing protein [Rhizobium leguminosarum]
MYPGHEASVHDILELASHYRAAAILLGECSPRGKPLSHAPRRFLALHSIELYLNAFLLAKGRDPKMIRGLQHNIGERSRWAKEAGLIFRKRTEEHLATLSREYLVTRYGPEMTATLSQVNRVMATLEELSQKVRKVIGVDKSNNGETADPNL